MGMYCFKGETNNTCQKQVSEGGKCKADYNCVNTHGCNNNTCVQYFSLPDETLLTNPSQNFWSLCASGEIDHESKCRTRLLNQSIESPCTEDCTYKNANESVITEPGTCKCSLNAGGKKYCMLGNGILDLTLRK